MKIDTILNGSNVITIDRTEYPIIDPMKLKESEDGLYRYIYYIFDHKNNKYYIGQHRTVSIIKDEYEGSGSKLLEAYEEAKEELGDRWCERFTKCIIAEAENEDELNFLEEKIVNKRVLKDYNSYNAIRGGKYGYKSSNAITIYLYDAEGNFIEKFPSINKAASWASQHINTTSSTGNLVSLIAHAIKREKYKTHNYYWVDYEIKDWDVFMSQVRQSRNVHRNSKNSPITIVNTTTEEKKTFKNRLNLAKWFIDNGYSDTSSTKQVLKNIMRGINEDATVYGFTIHNARLDRSKDKDMKHYVLDSIKDIQQTLSFINDLNVFLLYYGEKRGNHTENYDTIIELEKSIYTKLLGAVLMYNAKNGIKSDFDNISREFDFDGLRFRLCNEENVKTRLIVENVLDKARKRQ